MTKLGEITIVHSHNVSLDEDYTKWIYDVKKRFRSTQIKTAVKVNSEQLLFNWQLGRDLVVRRAEEKWGNGIVEQVSLDLQNEFPNMKGFSARNLWNMKKWYQFYSKDWEKLQQLVEKFENSTAYNTLKMHQVGAEIQEKDFLQQLVAESGEDDKLFKKHYDKKSSKVVAAQSKRIISYLRIICMYNCKKIRKIGKKKLKSRSFLHLFCIK